jgi:hypothetical protein
MHAYRKTDGAEFICGSDDVCRIEEGSTNPYLSEPRVLEQFLNKFEPRYSRACEALAANEFDANDVLIISGFIAFVIGCSPTAMRLGSASLQRLVETEAEILDRAGIFGPAPPELGSRTATELLREGTLRIESDEKFPQSMGISGIVDLTRSFASFHWEILLNHYQERSPFLTSDYPAALERPEKQVPTNRIVPLRPDLAIRIIPQIRPAGRPDLPTDFRYKMRKVSPSEVTLINRAIVRCAEQLVFSSVNEPWVSRMVQKNCNFRLQVEHTRIPKDSGFLLLNTVVAKEAIG